MVTAPTLFVSHGAPTFALEPGLLGPQLAEVGHQLDAARAVLVVSAHWQSEEVRVMTTPSPATVHDFFGFPEALDAIQYPAHGARSLARQAGALLESAGFAVADDDQRGLDHGAWVPLLHLRPAADIPVFQVSMPHDLQPEAALHLGATLRILREQGVVIVGSGSLTHNLYEFRQGTQHAAAYAQEFAAWVGAQVSDHNVQALVDYRRQGPHAARAHPTAEHYLPLLVALGARLESDALRVLKGGITHGVPAMDSYVFSASH